MSDIVQKLRAGWTRLNQNMSRRTRWVGIILLVIVIAAVAWIALRPAKNTARVTPPLPIVAATVSTGDMPIAYTALGTVTPLASVTVQSQIAGYLTAVNFNEGQEVKKGDLLATIDERPYQAALDQAQGQLSRDRAQLEGARVDQKRYATLMKQDSIAKQTYDDQVATVHQLEGTVQLDQAAVETARINLSYCRITAPIDGRVGLRQVDPGNYVTASMTNGLVLLNQMQPISVLFALPEGNLPGVLKGSRGGTPLAAAAFDRTGQTKVADGTLASVDNTINVSTGTFQLRASFPNPDESLYPNQFVNVQLTVDTLKNVVIIPISAVQRGAPGTFVYLVKSDSTVAATPVTLGASQGERVVVTQGLNAGDSVVVDGADKLKNGAKVTVRQNRPDSHSQQPSNPPGNNQRSKRSSAPSSSAAPASPSPAAPAPAGAPAASAAPATTPAPSGGQ